jgi:hypothetical protein
MHIISISKSKFKTFQNLRKIRCANGQIIRSPAAKTHTSIRQGVGTQPLSSANLEDESRPEDDLNGASLTNLPSSPSPTNISAKAKSPTSSSNSGGKEFKRIRGTRTKEGKLTCFYIHCWKPPMCIFLIIS